MPANKIFLYCYYIAFKTKDGCGWRIRETIHNLETSDGLMKIILELEKQEGKDRRYGRRFRGGCS